MKIAQVAPLFESVPPKKYGGTERIVSYLTEELVRQGHEVTLFASGDSVTQARLVPACPTCLRCDRGCVDPFVYHLAMLEDVYRRAQDFDVIHFHCDYLHFPVSRRENSVRLTTLHGRLDIPGLPMLYRRFSDEPLVSISNSQRRPLSWAGWVATIYHGIPTTLHSFRPGPGEYLAFLGRISPEKRVDRAIEIAIRAGQPLKIAAKVDRVDREYFYEQIEPLLKHPLVEFVGEVGGRDKDDFLGNASALLMPIDWPEPFGLCMIEAMACGVPVIAWRNGSVPEVVDEGITGFVVDSIDDSVRAVEQVSSLSRRRCREAFERRFSAVRMCEDYVAVYEWLLGHSHHNRYQKGPRHLEAAGGVAHNGVVGAPRRPALIPDVGGTTPRRSSSRK